MTLEEEVYDTQIEGHDDDGDVNDEEDCDSSDRGPCQSQVVRIAPVDVPALELCLASTSAVMDLLHKLHGPMCKRRECNRELDFESSFVGSLWWKVVCTTPMRKHLCWQSALSISHTIIGEFLHKDRISMQSDESAFLLKKSLQPIPELVYWTYSK
jgi:hypothetical protein